MEKIGANAKIQVIGVTGYVGSGKSTLLTALSSMGVTTLSTDNIIHSLYEHNKELINKILTLLGTNILTDQTLDRKKIAAKIFSQKELLFSLEKMTLPYVLEEIYSFAKKADRPIAIEFPLLFEYDLEPLFDTTIFVSASKETCNKRSSLKDIDLRNARFLKSEEKKQRASLTIENNGSLEEFHQTITHAMEGIIS
ncbi:dephospho-CoA kinase [bacterium]|nr:dephospho-CoA kinase [bacterium]